MIDQVITAPKQMSVEVGLAFAQKHQLGDEIPGFTEPWILDAPDTHIAEWKQNLASLKGGLSLHGPVYDLNPVSWDTKIAEISRLRYVQAANVCKALGCRFLVVHSQFSPIFAAANVKDEWLAESVEYWKKFADEVLEDTPTLNVVIENFMEETPDLLRTLIDGIDHPQIKACLDTGHANIFSPVSVNQWVDVLEHQLVYIHSHNNYGQTDEHRGYPYGTMDMESFLNHLVISPYKLNLALEIFNEPELKESYTILQRYLTIQQEQLPEKTFLI